MRNRIVIGACMVLLMGCPSLAAKDNPAKKSTAKAPATQGQAAKDHPAKKQTAKDQGAKSQPAKSQPAKSEPASDQPAKTQPKEEHPLADPEILDCAHKLAKAETLVYGKITAKTLEETVAEKAYELLDEVDAYCDEGNYRKATQTLKDVTKLVSSSEEDQKR